MTRTSVLGSVRTTGLVFLALFAILFASFTPIAATFSAQAAVSDGSISFNGTNQDITVPDSPAWDIGTGDYTVEWFQYMTSSGTFPRVFSFGGYPSADLGVSVEGGTLYVWSMSGYRLSASMPSDYLNHWKHVAIVRASGSLSIYVNGSRLATGSDSSNINVTRVFHIGSEGAGSTYFPGQISNFHFVNGTALYSGTSLTIPSNPITPVANTKLLLKSVTSGTLLTDSSANAFTLTATNSPTWSNTNPFSSFTTYTVTYNYNSATGGNGTASANFTVGGTALTLPTPTRTGYTFGGWYSDAGFTTLVGSGGASYSPSATGTLYAKWTAATYTVAYNYNSATGGNGTASASYTTGGASITLPTPTKTGYTFAGWYSDAGFTTSVGSAGASYSPSASGILYAKWIGDIYTVTYNYNSATGGNGTSSANYTVGGSAVTLPTPTKTGYNFGGWYSDSGLTTSVGSAGASYSPAASLTLYAKWNANSLVVTYQTNGGSTIVAGSTTVGGSISSAPTSPTKAGYDFAGWYSDAGLTAAVNFPYNHGQIADFTLYAKWTAGIYTVSYNYNAATGGNSTATASYTTGGSAVTLPSPTRTGYTFGGWYSDSGLTTSVGSAGASFTTTASVTLYAKWTGNVYTVTFNYNSATGGNGTTSASFTTGGASLVLPTPTRVGYAFSGWYSDSGLATLVGSAGASYAPSADATLYAKWTANNLVVTYQTNGGSSVTTGSTVSGDSILSAPTAPTKAGYDFAGWYSDSGLSTAVSFPYTHGQLADFTLYAKWTAGTYIVTYNYNSATGGNSTTSASYTTGGASITLPTPTKTGYSFAGWFAESGLTTLVGSAGASFTTTSAATLYAKWTGNNLAVTYQSNGGSSVTAGSTTSGGSISSAPTAPTKTGYDFVGWYSDSGLTNAVSFPYAHGQLANFTLYAKWSAVTYTVTYNYNAATGGNSTPSAAFTVGGSPITLPTPTRTNFVFDGWFDSLSGGNLIGAAAATLTPSASATIYAHWTQASLSGIAAGDLVSVGSLVASDLIGVDFGASTNGSSVHVTVPAGSLPSGTTITMNLLNNFTHAQTAITGAHDYVLSLVVSWLTTDGFVPTTNTGKPIAMTITNSAIKRGDAIYVLVHGVATMVGRATVDGQAVVEITDDPEIVIASTRPLGVTNVTATDGDDGSSTISWNAPSIDGGSAITSYTVTSSGGQTCTVATTSCTITGLTNGTSYTFTVVATNQVGNSTSVTSSSITPAAVVNTIQNVTPPVSTPVTPPVTTPVTPPVTTPVTPPATEPVQPPVTEPVTPPVTTPVTPTVPTAVTPAKPVTFVSSSIGMQLKPAQISTLKAMKAKKGFTVKITTNAKLSAAAAKALQSIAKRVTGAINAAFTKFKAKSSIVGSSKTPCKAPNGVCVVIAPTK